MIRVIYRLQEKQTVKVLYMIRLTWVYEDVMGRKKKNPEYDVDRIFKEYVDTVTEFYQAQAVQGESQSLRSVADEFNTTILKVRKVLITSGVFQSDTSAKVQQLFSDGKTIPEIQVEMQLSRASVYSYLPYMKTIYNAKELSANAQRLRTYRERKRVVLTFQNAIKDSLLTEHIMWDVISAFANYPFYTSRGMKFFYTVHGGEIQVNRKKKTITKATVLLFIDRVLEMQDAGEKITGPKKVGTFGASYLYPIFMRIGLVKN